MRSFDHHRKRVHLAFVAAEQHLPGAPPAPSWNETVPSCLPAFSFEGSIRTVTRAGVLPLVFGSTIQFALALAVQACAPPLSARSETVCARGIRPAAAAKLSAFRERT